jgi:hypothetical protein
LVVSLGLAGAATQGGNGLRVSPVRTDLTISPGQSATVPITVTNITTVAASLQAIVNDFTASSNESGDPALILGTNQYAPSHSLKRYIGPLSNVSLEPGQSAVVPVVITIPANTAGGGYYGAVRFAPASSGGTGQTVSLAGSVGSLIIVTVPGNIINNLNIASFGATTSSLANTSTGHSSSFFTSNKNIDVVVRFQNQGNIQEAPFGKILLNTHSGKTLSTATINTSQPPGNVLPASIRRFSVPISHIGSFGIFKLIGNFGYGSNGQLLSATTTIYVIPVFAVIAIVLIIVLILFLIFVLPRLLRAYNRRIIRQSRRR